MRIPDKEIEKHNWMTLEDCRYCSGSGLRVKHMEVEIHIGKYGKIYAETKDLTL